MLDLVYVTLTGNCRKFVKKCKAVDGSITSLELSSENANQTYDRPFLLIVPTYVHDSKVSLAHQFLVRNRSLCRGLIASGNRNFAQLYCFTAIDMSELYDVPMLYDFEFAGMPRDVDRVIELVKGNTDEAQLSSETI